MAARTLRCPAAADADPIFVFDLQHQRDAQSLRKHCGADERRTRTNDDAADLVYVQHGLLQWPVWLREHYRNGARPHVPPRDPADLQIRTPGRCLEKGGFT